jgi:surfactin synthase thioesterase subunit
LGNDIEAFYLHLPGREGRLRETPLTSVASMTELLVDAILPWLDRPFALFGHSLGGLVAFETARELRNRALPGPVALFVSATRAPQLPPTHAPLHGLRDSELLHAVNRRYSGSVPAVVLDSNELIELLSPALRADLMALETYRYHPCPPLTCPISVVGGRLDGVVTADLLKPWATHTTDRFQLRTMEGGHIYLQSALTEIVEAIRQDLTASFHAPDESRPRPAEGSLA